MPVINRPTENAFSLPSASVSLETARRVHAVCQQFEADWRLARETEAGAVTRPQLKSYLAGVAELTRSALLAELLALELELRSELFHEQPVEADYIEAFPADASLIDAVFRQRPDNSSTPRGTWNGQRSAAPRRLPSVEGYEILDVLGRGGMGVVYTARHLRLKRLVALKMILAGQYAGDEHLARFRAEAETVARLQHPNIVQIFDSGEQDGHPYLTFELIEGVTLAEFAHHEPLPPRTAAELVEVLARAMQYAHQQGIVHRDLKPANVVLASKVPEQGSAIGSRSETKGATAVPPIATELNTPPVAIRSSPPANGSGTSRHGSSSTVSASPTQHSTAAGFVPKITDFGLAKNLEGAADYTSTGAVLGTAQYMSPEQAAGRVRDIGPASDIYSLGAILYMLLTGRAPFQGTSPIETVQMVIENEPIAPTQLQARLPRDLETICLKCLRKQPAQRYATAGELADDLRRFQQNEPIVARPVGRIERVVKWTRRRPAIAALLLVTALGVAGMAWKYIDAEQQRAVADERRKFAETQQTLAELQRQEALRAATRANRARDFLVNIFKLSDTGKAGEVLSARQVLDYAEERIPIEFDGEAGLEEELLASIRQIRDRMESKSFVAMVLQMRGTVQLQSLRDADRRLAPQTLLYSGDRLHVEADGEVQLVFLSDLHKEWLKPGSDVMVRRQGSQPAEAVRERDQDILLTFVRLPRGTFYMGWDGENQGVKTEITHDFEIAVHEVTHRQWQAIMGKNRGSFTRGGAEAEALKEISDEELTLFPVENVSWHDAQQFIAKLNERERGRGWLYRLPSEAEWEYACRGGAESEAECSHHFYFAEPTNRLSSDLANFNGNLPFGQASKGVNLVRPSRVGSYPPNKLGVCDMHGNVWEWCSDRDSEFPIGVLRGGSWHHDGAACRAAVRHRIALVGRYDHHGFRLARVRVE